MLRSETLDAWTGAELLLKAEHLQRGGAFKFRGAYNALSMLGEQQRLRGVCAYSSGNHAQAVALAARLHATRATIVMPADTPQIKLHATRGYGADVVLYDRYTEDRAAIGSRLAEEHGLTLIPPFDHNDVIAGAGTTALELFEDTADGGPLDVLVVCLGAGTHLGLRDRRARDRSGHARGRRRASRAGHRRTLARSRQRRVGRRAGDHRGRTAGRSARRAHARDHHCTGRRGRARQRR